MRAFALIASLLVACGAAIPNYDYASEPDPRNKELVLGVGDVVGINVWENQGLTTDATIRPDGTITMPLVGDLKAAGETPSSLKASIKTRLQDFVKLQGTEITVAVKAWNSYRFTVQGEVLHTGVFRANEYVTVTDAIAMAGGLTRFANHDGVVLMRTDPKTHEMRRIPLDYDALASGRRPDMNIWVLPGDTIFVP